MKTSTIVLIGAGVGALILLSKTRKAGVGDDMLVPPTGRTLTSGGQVLGELGLETRFIDSYDASPSQYNSTPQNDFVPGIHGLGKKLKKVVHNVTSPVTKVLMKPINLISRSKMMKVLSVVDPIAFSTRLAASTVKIAVRTISNPAAGFKMMTNGVKSFTVRPLQQTGMVLGIIKPPKQKVSEGEVEYQDAEGNPIAKADYDKMATVSKASVPVQASTYKGYNIWTTAKPTGGTLYLINYKPEDNSTEGAYDTMAEAQAAIDAVAVPMDSPANPYPTGLLPVPQPPPASTYNQAKQAYDVMAAAREQASMSQASSDSGYGATSSDSGYGATSSDSGQPQQATEEGSPKLPERVAQVQTPAAQILPPEQAPPPAAPASSGNAKVGVLVGGGVLAAIAAALATR